MGWILVCLQALAVLVAGLVAIATRGRWLEERNGGGARAPRMPMAYVVTARLSPLERDLLIGRILLAISAGVCLLLVAGIVLGLVAEGR
jgi:hypothetical protein